MFAQLGTYIFKGLKTPVSWGESHAAKIGRIPHINARDAIQKTGDELAEINLTIQYESIFCEPTDEIAALKKTMQQSEVLPFISGDGDIIGKFVITALSVTNQAYTPAGLLKGATVSVTLLEYPAAAEKKKTTGAAFKTAAPEIQKPAAPAATPATQITTDLAKANNKVAQMKNTFAQIKKGMTTVKKGVNDVKKLADDTRQLYTTAKTKVEVTRKIIARSGHLPTSLDEAIKQAGNLAALSNVADSSVLEMNVKEMAGSAAKVNANAAPVVAFAATREGGC